MKVAVSSEGPGLESQVDPRFGRAGGFVVVDMETMQADYVENGASQAAAQGAGIQTAERLAGMGVQAVMSGYVGPKAFMRLRRRGSTCIRIWTTAAWAMPCAALQKVRSLRPLRPTSRSVCALLLPVARVARERPP